MAFVVAMLAKKTQAKLLSISYYIQAALAGILLLNSYDKISSVI